MACLRGEAVVAKRWSCGAMGGGETCDRQIVLV